MSLAVRHTILFVADEPEQIAAAREAAGGCHPQCEVQFSDDADVAFAQLTTQAPANLPLLVLLDLKLPKLDGLAALRSFRSHPVARDVPVLVCSTEYTQTEVLMGYQAGANSFVVKPLDVEQFKDLFSRQLSYWGHTKQRACVLVGR